MEGRGEREAERKEGGRRGGNERMRESPDSTHVLGSGHCGPGIHCDLFDFISSLC